MSVGKRLKFTSLWLLAKLVQQTTLSAMIRVRLGLLIAIVTGFVSSCTTSPSVIGKSVDKHESVVVALSSPTPESMRALSRRIAAGDVVALDELSDTAKHLYQDINYEKEQDRVMSNLRLMNAAFRVLGEEAGKGNTNAFIALKISLGKAHLRSFAPHSLGIAAAAGHAEALEMLLNYRRWGMLESSVVFALAAPAEKNNEKAVDFLVAILNNPEARSLWMGAAAELVAASNQGNSKATAALEKYAASTEK